MNFTIQKINNTKGLVYIGRSFSSAHDTQKIEPVEPLHDARFQYYYNLYIKGECIYKKKHTECGHIIDIYA